MVHRTITASTPFVRRRLLKHICSCIPVSPGDLFCAREGNCGVSKIGLTQSLKFRIFQVENTDSWDSGQLDNLPPSTYKKQAQGGCDLPETSAHFSLSDQRPLTCKTVPLWQTTEQWALHLTKAASRILNLCGGQLSGHTESQIYIWHNFQHMETISFPWNN